MVYKKLFFLLLLNVLKSSTDTENIHMEGSVSQILYLGLSVGNFWSFFNLIFEIS